MPHFLAAVSTTSLEKPQGGFAILSTGGPIAHQIGQPPCKPCTLELKNSPVGCLRAYLRLPEDGEQTALKS